MGINYDCHPRMLLSGIERQWTSDRILSSPLNFAPPSQNFRLVKTLAGVEYSVPWPLRVFNMPTRRDPRPSQCHPERALRRSSG